MQSAQAYAVPRSVRLEDKDLERIEALARHWGPVKCR